MRSSFRFSCFLTLLALCLGCGEEVPEGEIQRPRLHSCDADLLRERMIYSKTPKERALWHQEYIDRCEEELSKDDRSPLFQLIHLGKTKYDYGEHSRFHEIELPRRTRTFTKARLGLQEGDKKHPLVMLDCGMQCDLDRPSMKRMIMMLFDEGPFHVLALPNNSSHSYIKRNGVFSIGGLEEGYSFLRVAEYMKKRSKWKDRISSVHVLGISLGGHTALYSALYASYSSNRNPIDSFVVGCPVVDLKQSLEELYQPSLVGDFALKRFRKSVEDLADKASNLEEVLQDFTGKIRFGRVRKIVEDASVVYYQEEGNRWLSRTKPFVGEKVSSSQDFWSLSEFQRYAELVNRPVYIWSAADDNVVKTDANTLRLQQALPMNASIQISLSEVGGHCIFWDSFGWFNAGEIVRANLLSHSPKLLNRRIKLSMPIPYEDKEELRKPGESLRKIEWELESGEAFATLRILYRTGAGGYTGPYNRSVRIAFPLKDLGIQNPAMNEVDRQALRRRLNTSYRIWGEQSGVLRWNESPQKIEWFEY